MSEWKECTLGDLTFLVTKGTTPKIFTDCGINFVKSQSISYDGRIDKSLFGFIDEETHVKFKRSQLAKDDILFSMAGVFLGKNAIVSEEILPANTNQALAIIRLNPEKALPKFIHYFLRQKGTIEFVNNMSGQSAQPNINFQEIKSIEVPVPPLPEQRAIASVLSSLDDKIDLLHRQNQTLEAMAETLFRQWFVEEADEGWEEKQLKKVTNVAIGRTPPRKESQWFSTNPIDVKWISIKDMGSDGVFIFKTSEYLTREAVQTFNIPIIPKDTVVLSFKMTVGRVSITTENMLSNEAIAHFKFNNKTPFTKEFLYLFLKTYKYDSLGSTSSIVTAINSAMIKEMEIRIPDKEKMNSFQEKTEPLFNKIGQNQSQIRTVERLRDTLLPKLMSGEVRVEYESN
ncbi:MAG: restriction endonuclease subunit S [Methanosarcinaceae archaeon]|nr:restriction endonuclease subunit S [Methanosarcinaceae archaeon]